MKFNKRGELDTGVVKGIFALVLLLGVIVFAFGSCVYKSGVGNKQLIDLNYNFDYAIIELPNGEVVEGKVETWNDYEDGEQIQVKINGKTYLTNSYNCVLIDE